MGLSSMVMTTSPGADDIIATTKHAHKQVNTITWFACGDVCMCIWWMCVCVCLWCMWSMCVCVRNRVSEKIERSRDKVFVSVLVTFGRHDHLVVVAVRVAAELLH